jgi:hypothetical protein
MNATLSTLQHNPKVLLQYASYARFDRSLHKGHIEVYRRSNKRRSNALYGARKTSRRYVHSLHLNVVELLGGTD